MEKLYTVEKNVQIIISLLKAYGIRYIVASPGATNVTFVGSVQSDSYFKMYSNVDERSAAYMACGLAEESGEPVVLSCTGATASRNYLSGLTEAFYRKLPILAITSTQNISKVGHHIAQVIDRSTIQNDVAKLSVTLPIVKDNDDYWECEVKVNQALNELTRNGGGPVHINLPTNYNKVYNVKNLPECRVIRRITTSIQYPKLPKDKIAVFIGSHKAWGKEQTDALDKFCSVNNAVVFCDHTSGYSGKYRVLFALAASQKGLDLSIYRPDLLIHIGEVSGDYESLGLVGKEVWRVSEDGEIRDTFRKLTYVFEMTEQHFFECYSNEKARLETNSYLQLCNEELNSLRANIPELPFSNVWLAFKMAHKLPAHSTVHFAILNSLRAWNLFELPQSITTASNVGGFGIDGCLSSIIGASLFNMEKLYFGVIGDLSFFYDMNALGNRQVGKNLRILLINNGKGTEFRNSTHPAAHFGEDADEYIAAARHFGNKSTNLVRHYAEDLGFEYLCAANKDQFNQVYERFITPEILDQPILLEVFTTNEDESKALEDVKNIAGSPKVTVKQYAKSLIGKKGLGAIKKVIGK